MKTDLEELAARVEVFSAKIRAVMCGGDDLSAQGAAVAVAMIVALNLDAFEQVPAALRARSHAAERSE